MPRSRIFSIYALVIIFALGAGTLVARFFGSTGALPSGYTTPAAGTELATQTVPSPTNPAAASAVATASDAVQRESPTVLDQSTIAPTSPSELPTALVPTAVPSEQPTALPEQPTVPPEVGYIEYTVQKGDTLKTIAETYSVTIRDILSINQIPDPDSLVVGTVIRVPKT